jgi:hypothetical protein
MTDSMQIKEPEVNTNSKTVVKISAEGEVLKCAKGLDTAECGYKAGAKVCGACGAMATQVKGEDADADDVGGDSDPEEQETCKCDSPIVVKGMCKKCGMPVMDEKMMDSHIAFDHMRSAKKGKKGNAPDADFGVGMEREADEEVYDEDNFDPKKRARSIVTGKSFDSDAPAFVIDSDITGKEYGTGQARDMEPNDTGFHMDLKKKRKKRRLDSMGMGAKSDDMVEDLFLCALGREVKSASTAGPCADCRGGCQSKGLEPDLLEIEGLAEDMLLGKVHNSGYSDEYDMFVVQVERKDGQYVEAYFTGEGDLDGWFRIPEEEVFGKSDVVDIQTAVEKALGTIEGKALSYGVGEFEGYEAFAIEVEALDGKSYDVYVTPDGHVLGYDQYEWDYEDTVEGKRAYSQEDRNKMAKGGEALPDGSYPIADENDLENAVQAFGRAKDKGRAKAHIMKRAAALGREDLIPEDWSSEEKVALSEIEAALLEMDMLAIEQDLI